MSSIVSAVTSSLAAMSLPAKYKCAQISKKGGKFEIVERDLPKPGFGQVLIQVLAEGVCHSDSLTVDGAFGNSFPRVPGHETIGKVVALGEHVKRFKVGDIVGRGWLGGHCFCCNDCLKGHFVTCKTNQVSGITDDGGYAEYVLAPWESLAAVPAGLKPEIACSLLCAGVTVFNGMRLQNISPGSVVAVQGIGGLGHLAIQFAKASGFKVVALSGSDSKKELATKLGAHHYIDGSKQDTCKELQKLGGAQLIVCTAFDAEAQSKLVDGLSTGGTLLSLGVDMKPFKVTPVQLIPAGKKIVGHPSGSPQDSQETLEFAALAKIEPMIEVFSLDEAQKAYDSMMSGKVRFRAVIVPGKK